MEKFNFVASIITVSGVSVFTIITGMKDIDTFKLGYYILFFAVILTIVSFMIGVYYVAITTMKKDWSKPVFYLIAFILNLFLIGFILLIVSTAWEFITNVNFVS